MPRQHTNDQGRFKLSHTLQGLSEGVNALAISPDGLFLLSGCTDGQLMIWNITTGERLQDIDCAFNGQISCITWTDTTRAFVFGCGDGSVHLYRWSGAKGCYIYVVQEKAHSDAVQNVAYDSQHKRIASISKSSLQMWAVVDSRVLKLLFSHTIVSEYQGRTVHFCDDGASVISTYLESHQIACHTIEPWTLKWIKQIPTRFGGSALNGKQIMVSNLCDGLDLYSLPTMELKRNFTHAIALNVILQVEIISQLQWAVVGGDDGFVRIFDMRSGSFLFSLVHGETGHLVQTLTTYEGSDNVLIATASSQDGDIAIKIWTRMNSVAPKVVDNQEHLIPQVPAPSSLSLAQLVLIFALVSVVINQISAYFTRLTAGGTLDDMVQLMLSSVLVSSIVNTTQGISNSNL
ncbi:hypothetical protein HWV62_21850 [Athelia sp. TMB]|nr:hypothetical protein HWV62_21850 [Athelia sp. TMB]